MKQPNFNNFAKIFVVSASCGFLLLLAGCPPGPDPGKHNPSYETLRDDLAACRKVLGNPTDPPIVIKGGSLHLLLDDADGTPAVGSPLPKPIGDPADLLLKGYTPYPAGATVQPPKSLSGGWAVWFCADAPQRNACAKGMKLASSGGGIVVPSSLGLAPNDDFYAEGNGGGPYDNGWQQDFWEFADKDDNKAYFPRYLVISSGGTFSSFICSRKNHRSDFCTIKIGHAHDQTTVNK